MESRRKENRKRNEEARKRKKKQEEDAKWWNTQQAREMVNWYIMNKPFMADEFAAAKREAAY